MKHDAQEPIFTPKGWAAIAVLGCVYAAILFSLDPEWVAWAAPLAFGGALYAPGPAPASAQFSLPGQAIPTAYWFSLGGLFALASLARTVAQSPSAWLHSLKERLHGGRIVLSRSHGKVKSVLPDFRGWAIHKSASGRPEAHG